MMYKLLLSFMAPDLVVTERVHAAAHRVQEEPDQGGGAAAQVRGFHRGHH